MTRVRSSLTSSEKVKSIRTFLPFLLCNWRIALAMLNGYSSHGRASARPPPPISHPLAPTASARLRPHYIMCKHGKDRTAKLFLRLQGSCSERASAAEARISDYRVGTLQSYF